MKRFVHGFFFLSLQPNLKVVIPRRDSEGGRDGFRERASDEAACADFASRYWLRREDEPLPHAAARVGCAPSFLKGPG